jgi:prevent-host-death family protein
MEAYMSCEQIGMFEAKTHFSKIIEKAKNGTDFIITQRGKPVAKIIPFEQENKMTQEEVIERFRELRKNYRGEPGSFDIRAAIKEGRRY